LIKFGKLLVFDVGVFAGGGLLFHDEIIA
jgi:hypothetical protein